MLCGSRGFSVRASHGLFPPRAPDMLTVRIGQWTVWGLSPHQIRSLVGCSPLTVGTSVTRGPPHRPGRAVFPHPVPRLYSLSRRTKSSCIHHVLSLSLSHFREGYTYTVQRSFERLPGQAFPLAASSVEPCARTLLRPRVETVERGPVPPESVIVVM